jgi:quinol monooxygenase YgiN
VENKGVMAELDKDIISGDTVLLHVAGNIFGLSSSESGAGSESGLIPLLESPVISIGRMFVKKANKEAFAARFEEVKGIAEEYARPHLVRYGWREDVEDGAEEEFVLVAGWESVEKHLAFAETEAFARYGQIREFVARVDLKHYKRLSLE